MVPFDEILAVERQAFKVGPELSDFRFYDLFIPLVHILIDSNRTAQPYGRTENRTLMHKCCLGNLPARRAGRLWRRVGAHLHRLRGAEAEPVVAAAVQQAAPTCALRLD